MIPKIVNYKTHVRGSTIKARTITLNQTVGGVTSPMDLTGAIVKMDLINGSNIVNKTIGSGITIADPQSGVIVIDKFRLEHPGQWDYDIDIEFPDDVGETWIMGVVPIKDDITK